MVDEGFEPTRMAYAGRRWASGPHKIFHAFYWLDGPDPTEEQWWAKAPQHADVGGIFEVQRKGDTVQFGHATRVGSVDEAKRSEWRLLDQANRTEQERYRAQQRLAKSNGDIGDLTLRQVREAMRTQPQYVADGSLTAVIRYLTRLSVF